MVTLYTLHLEHLKIISCDSLATLTSCLLLSCKMRLGEGSGWSGSRGRSGSIPSSSCVLQVTLLVIGQHKFEKNKQLQFLPTCHRDRSDRVPHHGRGLGPAAPSLLRLSLSCPACTDPAGCTCQTSSSPCLRPAARSCGRLRPGRSSRCCRICSSRRPSPPSG